MTIRAVIVDDEALARERIRTLLAGEDDVTVVTECPSGRDALRAVRDSRPDVLFLDVQMPGMDGFSVLEALDPAEYPAVVVFVTAYDAHAVRAFDANALDYLLKPFTRERFARAMERVRTRLRDGGSNVASALKSAALTRIPVRTENGTYFVRLHDVDWVEADGNYLRLHTGAATAPIRETISNFSKRLDAAQFIRIHRSLIVNVDRIARVEPWSHGEYVVVLKDGSKLKSGRAFSAAVRLLIRH